MTLEDADEDDLDAAEPYTQELPRDESGIELAAKACVTEGNEKNLFKNIILDAVVPDIMKQLLTRVTLTPRCS